MPRSVSRRKDAPETRTMETVEPGSSPPPAPVDATRYADDHARMSYEVAAQLRQLDETLPPDEGRVVTLTPIAINARDEDRAAMVLLFAGDFMETTEDESVVFIRPRTQKMLDALNIRYRVVRPTARPTQH